MKDETSPEERRKALLRRGFMEFFPKIFMKAEKRAETTRHLFIHLCDKVENDGIFGGYLRPRDGICGYCHSPLGEEVNLTIRLIKFRGGVICG
jgi:hypothetical protein